MPPAHGVPPPPDPQARLSLAERLAGGPAWRRVALIDLGVYRFMRTRGHQPPVERVIWGYSTTGEHAALWLAVGAVGIGLDPARRDSWRSATEAVAAAYLLNTALKSIVRRARPALDDLPQLIATPSKLSFPSAHASSSFAAARAFGPLLPPRALYAAAAAMATSRVYLGVHYPTDVVAGALLGTAVGSAGRQGPS